MDDTKLKAFLRELMMPVLDAIVDSSFNVCKAMYNGFPKELPEEEKLKYIKTVFETQQQAIVKGMDTIVPNDLASKIKEATNGRG